jgi:hypothetical protein
MAELLNAETYDATHQGQMSRLITERAREDSNL